MANPELEHLLDQAIGPSSASELGWRKLGFSRNPFPSRAHPNWDVFCNQTAVRNRFYSDLAEFLRDSNTLTLFFTGGNRVGKTHFMEYHRRFLTVALRDRGLTAPIIVASAQSSDFWQLYSQIIEQADESLRLQRGSGLFESELPAALLERLEELPPGDFRRAISAVLTAQPAEAERKRLLLRRWLWGERLRAPQRAELGVLGLLDSQAELLNALEGIVKFLLLSYPADTSEQSTQQPFGLRCPGIVVFVDEFELVWRSRRDRRDQFLQALRAMLDVCPRGLFLCVAMATGLGVATLDVESSYPALFARLKGARSIPALVQIGGVIEAIEYVREFERHAKQEYLREHSTNNHQSSTAERLFSDREIEDIFREIAPGGSVSQGDFFDRVHLDAERKLRELTDQRHA